MRARTIAAKAPSKSSWTLIAGGDLEVLQLGGMRRLGRIPEHGDACDPRDDFLEQLQPLDVKLVTNVRHSGNVAARACEASGEPTLHGVADIGHHDGNGVGGVLSGLDAF